MAQAAADRYLWMHGWSTPELRACHTGTRKRRHTREEGAKQQVQARAGGQAREPEVGTSPTPHEAAEADGEKPMAGTGRRIAVLVEVEVAAGAYEGTGVPAELQESLRQELGSAAWSWRSRLHWDEKQALGCARATVADEGREAA